MECKNDKANQWRSMFQLKEKYTSNMPFWDLAKKCQGYHLNLQPTFQSVMVVV